MWRQARRLGWTRLLAATLALVAAAGLIKRHQQARLNASSSAPALAANAQACRVPSLRIDDPSVIKHFKSPTPLKCGDGLLWVTFPGNVAKFDPEVAKSHGKIDCSYQYIIRDDDFRTSLGPKTNMSEGWSPAQDMMRIQCRAKDGTEYKNMQTTVVPKIATDLDSKYPKDRLSIYILGIDSLSRLTFMRKLPKAYAYLTDHLEAAVLEGYNIVGDGTPQALIPILTGETEEELPTTRRGDTGAQFVNVYPWLWNEFEAAGYATMYHESASAIGTFQYRLRGFSAQPTTHYGRTMYVHRDSAEGKAFLTPGEKGHCQGPEPEHKFFWRFGEGFALNYVNKTPTFGFLMHDVLSHDDINLVELADGDLVSHLRRLEDGGALNRSLLLVLADHGHRFTALRSTHQGQMEERLPFVSITAPEWWRKANSKAWANLLVNQHRLASPFDLHPTLKDLLHWDTRGGIEKGPNKPKRGRSLWAEIPMSRTCDEADIAPHWCTCLHWEPLEPESELANELAAAVVGRLNEVTLVARDKCVPLVLQTVNRVTREVPNPSLLKYKGVLDKHGFVADLSGQVEVAFARYQLQFSTLPNRAIYEVTAGYHHSTKELTLTIDDVSRINRYDDQPHCIKAKEHTRLLNFCLCPDKVQS